jgi:hypothetical protein
MAHREAREVPQASSSSQVEQYDEQRRLAKKTKSDAERSEEHRERMKQRMREKRADPAYKEAEKARRREQYDLDPVYRQGELERSQNWKDEQRARKIVAKRAAQGLLAPMDIQELAMKAKKPKEKSSPQAGQRP